MILLVGDMTFDGQFIDGLRQACTAAASCCCTSGTPGPWAIGWHNSKRLAGWRSCRPGPIRPPAIPAAISNTRLAQLIVEHLPVVVEGDPIQYQVNRNRQGWVIELVHNGGVIKKPDRAAVVDTESVAHVRLRPRVSIRKVRVWGSKQDSPLGPSLAVTIPAGRSRCSLNRFYRNKTCIRG